MTERRTLVPSRVGAASPGDIYRYRGERRLRAAIHRLPDVTADERSALLAAVERFGERAYNDEAAAGTARTMLGLLREGRLR